MIALITGVTGFVGSHLAEYLVTRDDIHVHGTRRPRGSTENIQHLLPLVTLHDVDITDAPSAIRLLDEVRPDVIFHLAAQSYVRTSWESPHATLLTNIGGQVNLLEALRLLKNETYNPPFLIAGSSEEYGLVEPHELPITETNPLRPLSPYAVSKIGQDFLGYQYHQTYGLKVIRLRVFNHSGPRRPTAFGDSHIAHTIALIERGAVPPRITYRDLRAVRDFTDVRDIVRAYFLAVERCDPGTVYNVCSGTGISINTMVETLLALSTVQGIAREPDPMGPRPTDGRTIVGDNTRFVRQTGWQPQRSFLKETLPDILQYWRQRISA